MQQKKILFVKIICTFKRVLKYQTKSKALLITLLKCQLSWFLCIIFRTVSFKLFFLSTTTTKKEEGFCFNL